jgi:hypothetical protein
MNELDRLERIVRAARHEPAPRIDVADRVIDRIRARRPAVNAPLAILAATSSVAAAVVAVVAAQTWLAWQDPFASLLRSLDVVLQ